MQDKTKNRITIVLTILFFAVPVVAAYLMNSGWLKYEPTSTKNKGVFISPPVKLADLTEAQWADDLNGHWTLIRRLPEACSDQCDALQDELHRYRLSLGRRAEKLDLMLLADGHDSTQTDQYPHIKKTTIDPSSPLKQVMNDLSAQSLGQGAGLYVVAPEGYLMLAFTPENTSTEVIRDLQLLVKRKGS